MRLQEKQKRTRLKNINLTSSLIISDVLFTLIALLSAYILRNKVVFNLFLDIVQPVKIYLIAFPLVVALLVLIYSAAGLYNYRQRRSQFAELYSVLKATTLWTLIIMAGSYMVKFDYSRIIVVLFYLLTVLFVIVGRLIVRKIQNEYFHLGFGRTNILIIGSGSKANEMTLRIKKYEQAGLHFSGFVNNNKGRNVLGKISGLRRIIIKYEIDEIFIIDSKLSSDQTLNLISKCRSLNVKFRLSSNVFSLVGESIDLANLDSLPYLDLSNFEAPWWKLFPKRILDIFFGTLVLVITIPLWIIIAFLIKIDSKGKALFMQKRVGMNGKVFKMYKFRTMKMSSSLYAKAPLVGTDKRITKVGHLLRSTSLDELPQILNVVKGDMSLVGPRPEMEFIVKKYKKWQRRRLDMKPGLTGLWQILGRKDLPLHDNLEYDFYYINNQSFLLDLVILLKTIPAVLFKKGAF